MALLSDLETMVTPECPGVSYPMVMAAISATLKEFFAESRIWEIDLAQFNTEAGLANYELAQPADIDVVDIAVVRVNGRKVDPTTEADLDDAYNIDWTTLEGVPTHFITRDGGARIGFFRRPSGVYPVKVRAIVTVSDAAQTYPDFVNVKYREGIVAGIKANLQVMSDVAWSNANAAVYNQQRFEDAKNKAKADAFNGRTMAKRRTVARFI